MPAEHPPAKAPEPGARVAAPPDARIAEIASWLGQFSRTLKTCRLYDAANPNTIRFREELCSKLVALLQKHGPFRLAFTSNQVTCDGHTVMTAQGRDDNFAMPFYRDGLYSMRFAQETEPQEVERLLDIVLRVTGRTANGVEDLVTLLWDADMPHVAISYVSSETDADLGDDADPQSGDAKGAAAGPVMPWPASGFAGESRNSESGDLAGDGLAAGAQSDLRSEDWLAGEPGFDLERAFEELDSSSAVDVDAFMTRMHAEHAAKLGTATVELVRDVIHCEHLEEDKDDLVELLERILHESISAANWGEADTVVKCLEECTSGYWDAAFLVQELAQPESVVTASLVRYLDEHTLAETNEFVEFARGLGAAAIEWLMGIVAIANHQRTRKTLLRALTELCQGHPERLTPWFSDPRWYVVRNAVLVVGATGGDVPVGIFVPLLRHAEVRVRQEVVAALANIELDQARPLLLELVRDPESSVRGPALHRLGSRKDPRTSAALVALVVEPSFRKRPEDEVRSVLSALGGCAGDEVLPELENQLLGTGGFLGPPAPYAQAIARCIARIGTPAAISVLEQGARSRVVSARDACRMVLKGAGHA